MSNLTDKLQIKINDQQQEVNKLLVEQIKLLNQKLKFYTNGLST